MEEPRRLEGLAAIITGGATGIGRATAVRFGREGASVMINGLPDDPIDEAVREVKDAGGAAAGFTGDVSTPEAAARCVDAALRAFDRLDILVNNAGVMPDEGGAADAEPDRLDDIVSANVATAVRMTRAALPHLRRRRGVVLFTGSEAGLNGKPDRPLYAGSKGWLHAYARSIALAEADAGVRANCVCPGPVETPLVLEDDDGEQAARAAAARVPLGRLARPEEVAAALAFAASAEAAFMTGALLVIDGGESIAKGGGRA